MYGGTKNPELGLRYVPDRTCETINSASVTFAGIVEIFIVTYVSGSDGEALGIYWCSYVPVSGDELCIYIG